MKSEFLFQSRGGGGVTSADLLRCLAQAQAHDAQVLFIHSELSFGIPNPALSRKSVLEQVVEVIRELGVPTVCVPTFTFSFCNGNDYDVANSRSKMGALNEYIRQIPGSVRSVDPLMSVAAFGRDLSVVQDIGHHSIGVGSTFDMLHARPGARFLFLGARPSQCMTYTHYVEERFGVPYRYNRDFTGTISDQRGSRQDTYTLFVRYQGVIPSPRDDVERQLVDRRLMHKIPCGDAFIFSVPEPAVYETVWQFLEKDINSLLAEPFKGERNTHFEAHNMVAL
jgi:aminoglycoside 3-N-acetyltransferase